MMGPRPASIMEPMARYSFQCACAALVISYAASLSLHAVAALPAAPAVEARASSMQATMALPEGPGKAIVERTCTMCHGTEVLLGERSVDLWEETLELMKSFGAEATDEEWETIADYVIAQLAIVNINKAEDEEIELLF